MAGKAKPIDLSAKIAEKKRRTEKLKAERETLVKDRATRTGTTAPIDLAEQHKRLLDQAEQLIQQLGANISVKPEPEPERKMIVERQSVLSILPKITYEREAQTTEEGRLKDGGVYVREGQAPAAAAGSPASPTAPVQPQQGKDGQAQQTGQQKKDDGPVIKFEDEKKEIQPMKEKVKREILTGPDFQNYWKRAAQVIERVLATNENYDPMVDYSTEQQQASKVGRAAEKMTIRTKLAADDLTAGRPVTSLDHSPVYDELYLAAYGESEVRLASADEPDGLVLVWSDQLPNKPEFRLSCQSTVLAAKFHPTNPKLLIGATYTGEVVLWDMRTDKSTPVARTSLAEGHTYPIYCLFTVPSVRDVHSILSLSTDGKMCVWSDQALVTPREVMFKLEKKESQQRAPELTASCFSLSPRDPTVILFGSDEGTVYKGKYNTDNQGVYDKVDGAHDGPITAIQFHPTTNAPSPKQVQDVFLTASYDWTVKLWNDKLARPVYTFETYNDYVYDLQWSPTHPSLFASGDGAGFVTLWNLNVDLEVPAIKLQVSPDAAINRIKFKRDGSRLVAGTSKGDIYVLDLIPELHHANQVTWRADAPGPASESDASSGGAPLALTPSMSLPSSSSSSSASP